MKNPLFSHSKRSLHSGFHHGSAAQGPSKAVTGAQCHLQHWRVMDGVKESLVSNEVFISIQDYGEGELSQELSMLEVVLRLAQIPYPILF